MACSNIRSCVEKTVLSRGIYVITTLPPEEGLAQKVFYLWMAGQLVGHSTKVRCCTASKLWSLYLKSRKVRGVVK
jgi:hypothetical protein